MVGYSYNSISKLGASNINSVAAEASESKVENKSGNSGTAAYDLQSFSFNSTFDQDLKYSRPYARAEKRNSSWSTNSSAFHTMSWSCLSGLSLAEISKTSVIGLPITAQELWNGDNYTTIQAELSQTLERNEASTWYGGEGGGVFGKEKLPRKTREGSFLHKRVHSVVSSSALSNDQLLGKLPVSVDGGQLENRKILLLGQIQ